MQYIKLDNQFGVNQVMSILVISVVLIFLILGAVSLIRKQHGAEVRVVWYFFSLSVVAVAGIACHAISVGAIDEGGNFHGKYGEFIMGALNFMLDLKGGIFWVTGAVVLFLLPQLLSYVLSGISGCASAPLFISGSFDFLVWGYLKAFVTCAGITFSIGLLCFSGLIPSDFKSAPILLPFSLLLLLVVFSFLFLYLEGENYMRALADNFPKLMQRCIKVHRFFTRHVDSQ